MKETLENQRERDETVDGSKIKHTRTHVQTL